ncbi:hypothetical protein VTK73DRAFT_3439 [Phialemonium thermophilum]|uniref:Uncharacterized protein n=1 Tax=Phialemonium thermophilum TaxID=223376 RepID=A0ABR3VIB8_9PEZI
MVKGVSQLCRAALLLLKAAPHGNPSRPDSRPECIWLAEHRALATLLTSGGLSGPSNALSAQAAYASSRNQRLAHRGRSTPC